MGPGRIERALRRRIEEAELEARVAAAREAARARELELSQRVERGAQRRLDRLEQEVHAARAAVEQAGQRERRLILALGALQRENELLRAAAELPAARRAALPPARREPWWRRILGSARGGGGA